MLFIVNNTKKKKKKNVLVVLVHLLSGCVAKQSYLAGTSSSDTAAQAAWR